MREWICGIDLGTTNSSIAHLVNGKPVAVPIEEGSALVPSVVSLERETGRIVVGRQAKNRLGAFPEATVRSIKRLMGRDGSARLGDQQFSPEELSSFILSYLAHRASKTIGRKVERVVITVPAYFNDAQRRATIRAGEMAELEVARIVNEPTAASLVYDYVSLIRESTSPFVMVYDLGGGTFDVSILEVKGEIKEVLASCGDTALGGDDFDDRLAGFFLRHLKESSGVDFSDDRLVSMRLREIAEKTKIILSDSPHAQVSEVAVARVGGEPVNLQLEIARSEFEEMIMDLVEKTGDKVKEALKEARLRAQDVDRIILVGGATRMPVVQNLLSGMFSRPIYHSVDPDLCVSLGAAVQGGLMAGEPLGHILVDVTAHSLGVKTADVYNPETGDADYYSIIVRRNTRVPVRKAELYYTMVDKQREVQVEVYQGESSSCLENTLVGAFRFPLKPAPRFSPVVTEFAYDREGLVHVTVEQKGYDNRKEATLDVRRRQVVAKEEMGEGVGPVNYIAEAARGLLRESRLPVQLSREIRELTEEYEEALTRGDAGDAVDSIEDCLLEQIEEAKERLEKIEQEGETRPE